MARSSAYFEIPPKPTGIFNLQRTGGLAASPLLGRRIITSTQECCRTWGLQSAGSAGSAVDLRISRGRRTAGPSPLTIVPTAVAG